MKEKTKKITSVLLSPVLAAGMYLGKAAPVAVTALTLTKCGDSNSSEDEQTREQYGTFGSIPVWQEVGVSDADMDKIWGYLETIKADFDWINDGNTALLEAVLAGGEIQIHPGSALTRDGNILKIGAANDIGAIGLYMSKVAKGLALLNQKNILPLNGYQTMQQHMMAQRSALKSVIVRS